MLINHSILLDDPVPDEIKNGDDKERHDWIFNHIDNMINR